MTDPLGAVPLFWTYLCQLQTGEEHETDPFEASTYEVALERGRLVMQGAFLSRLEQNPETKRWEVPIRWQTVSRAGYWPPQGLPRIEIGVWEPMGGKPGFLQFVRNKTYREVADELKPIIAAYGFELEESPHHLAPGLAYGPGDWKGAPADQAIPPYRWVASYVVRGGSEGHWGHVDLLTDDGKVLPFLLSKTLREGVDGWKRASQCASAVGYILGA